MSGYWPWWAGALALGAVTVGYAWAVERSFGLSGAWDRVIHWRRERHQEREDAVWAKDEAALRAAMVAATDAEFGSSAAAPGATTSRGTTVGDGSVVSVMARRGGGSGLPARGDSGPSRGRRGRRGVTTPARPVPVAYQAVLLASVFAGALLAALTSGRFQVRADMGEGFSRIVTDSPVSMIVLLFVGGVLVGFGTRLAGGCSSGHGLSGCSRLQPASFVATAVFFATAALVSFLLWKVL